MSVEVSVVLFDMGGVIVELGSLPELLGVTENSVEDFWPRWLASPSVRAFESGRCELGTFGADLVEELDLALTPADFIDRFSRFAVGLYPGAVELVRSLPDDVQTGLLSNTNALHWEHQPDAAIVQGLFDRPYLSFRLGLLKPDQEIFEYVIGDLGVAPSSILFIDDNQVNVDGARAAGLTSEVAKGPAQAHQVLANAGLL